ncbi:MAG: hypothetical protein ACUVT8_03190 [Armatimonadota bacterium]
MRDCICQVCRSAGAEVLFARWRGGECELVPLCRECVRERALLLTGHTVDVSSVFETFAELSKGDSRMQCEICGMSLVEIIAEGRPGCPNCYVHHGSVLMKLVESMQGHRNHVGKTPLE